MNMPLLTICSTSISRRSDVSRPSVVASPATDAAAFIAPAEYVHVAIDDHSRIAFSQILPNQKAPSAAAFLQAAVDYYARLGIAISRVLTDNGPCYRSGHFRQLCQ
jgi:transposase InsO family protein